jgi:hypothetical protein
MYNIFFQDYNNFCDVPIKSTIFNLKQNKLSVELQQRLAETWQTKTRNLVWITVGKAAKF